MRIKLRNGTVPEYILNINAADLIAASLALRDKADSIFNLIDVSIRKIITDICSQFSYITNPYSPDLLRPEYLDKMKLNTLTFSYHSDQVNFTCLSSESRFYRDKQILFEKISADNGTKDIVVYKAKYKDIQDIQDKELEFVRFFPADILDLEAKDQTETVYNFVFGLIYEKVRKRIEEINNNNRLSSLDRDRKQSHNRMVELTQSLKSLFAKHPELKEEFLNNLQQ